MGTDFYEQWSELYRNAKTNDQRWELIDFKDAFLQYTDGTLIQDISDFIMDHPAYAIGAGGGSCDDRCYRRNWRNSSHYRCTICISRGVELTYTYMVENRLKAVFDADELWLMTVMETVSSS